MNVYGKKRLFAYVLIAVMALSLAVGVLAEPVYVYITTSGSYYHSSAECSNMVSPKRVTQDEAISRGYKKCTKCWSDLASGVAPTPSPAPAPAPEEIDKYYKEFPAVANFGYYAKVDTVKQYRDGDAYIYQYSNLDIFEKNGENYLFAENWENELAKSGFLAWDETDNGIVTDNAELVLTMTYDSTYIYVTIISKTLTATPTTSTVFVNGKLIAFDAYNINGSNYFKLRDLAFAISDTNKCFDVGWDEASNAISLISGKAYTIVGGEMSATGFGEKTANLTGSLMLLDGKKVRFTAYNIEGNNYFKLRDIGQAFDIGVDWDASNNAIIINTEKSYG